MDKYLIRLEKRRAFLARRRKAYKKVMKNHPEITIEQSEEEDYIMLYEYGMITKLQLIDLLSGEEKWAGRKVIKKDSK